MTMHLIKIKIRIIHALAPDEWDLMHQPYTRATAAGASERERRTNASDNEKN